MSFDNHGTITFVIEKLLTLQHRFDDIEYKTKEAYLLTIKCYKFLEFHSTFASECAPGKAISLLMCDIQKTPGVVIPGQRRRKSSLVYNGIHGIQNALIHFLW